MKYSSNIEEESHETTDYRASYEYGLFLFKDSLKEINRYPYWAMLPYFEYPLSIIEKEVKESRNNGIDTNEFYKEQCDKLLEMYNRLLATCLLSQSQVGTNEEKNRANEVLKLLKNQPTNSKN